MTRYRPTPAGLNRDAAAVLHILAKAHAQLDHHGVDPATESTAAGSMWAHLTATGDAHAANGRLATIGGRTTPPVESTADTPDRGTHATLRPHR